MIEWRRVLVISGVALAFVLVVVLLHGCGGGDSGSSAPASPLSAWKHAGRIPGVSGNYTPLVIMGANAIRVFSNTENGVWQMQDGTWAGVGAPLAVVAPLQATDAFVRTSGVVRLEDGTFSALLHVGPCYGSGCVAGFSPAWATSSDGYSWEYRGRASTPFGIYQSSAANLVWTGTEYQAIEDGTGVQLALMRSRDGITWTSDRRDVWPIDGSPQFCSATRTPEGTHMVCADGFPASRHVWVFSCDGAKWRVVEESAGTKGEKGTNLAFDGAATLHALTAGEHYTAPALGYACP